MAGIGSLLALGTTNAIAHGGTETGIHHQMWGDGHMWGAGMVGWGWFVLLVVLVVLAFVAMAVLIDRDTDDDGGALATLRERYARGEIDEEEFETRRARLEQ